MKFTIGVDPNRNAAGLRVTANVLLCFRSDRRWIDLKHFVFSANPSDVELLAKLTSHFQFKDGYMGRGPRDVDIHGPYRLDAVTPERYQAVDQSTAVGWLDDFCSMFDSPLEGALAEDIDLVVRRRLAGADALYRLPTLEGAQHDVAWVLQEFRELVAIRRGTQELSLVVMGID